MLPIRACAAKFGKDRLYRSAKRRALERLETNGKAAPSVLLPPFQNWITLHSPTPFAVFTTTCSLKSSPTHRHILYRASQVYCEQTGDYLCTNGPHVMFIGAFALITDLRIGRAILPVILMSKAEAIVGLRSSKTGDAR